MPLLLLLARRLNLLVGFPIACGVIAVCVSLASAPVFTATARILPPQYNENTVMAMQNQLGGESLFGNSALTLKNPTDLFVGILTSRTILDAVIRANALDDYYGEPDLGDVREILRSMSEIRAGKDGIISIAVEDEDRTQAATLANAYVEQFYALSRSLARDQVRLRESFYRNALDKAKASLAEADAALVATEKATGFTRLAGQDQAIVQLAVELQAKIAAREVQLKTMSDYATPSNPDVRILRSELANLRDELAELKAPGSAVVGEMGAAPFIGLGDVPDALLARARGKREVEYWEGIVNLLGRYSELGKIDERRDMSLFQVLDYAIPPHDKSKPRTGVNGILATLGGGILCMLWVLVSGYVEFRRRLDPEFDGQWQDLMRVLVARCRWWPFA